MATDNKYRIIINAYRYTLCRLYAAKDRDFLVKEYRDFRTFMRFMTIRGDGLSRPAHSYIVNKIKKLFEELYYTVEEI